MCSFHPVVAAPDVQLEAELSEELSETGIERLALATDSKSFVSIAFELPWEALA